MNAHASAPAMQPNTCFMGTGESYGTMPSAPTQPHFEGYTPGWSYTDYAGRESSMVPVELTTNSEKPESTTLDTQCRVRHHYSWFMQIATVATFILATQYDWLIAIASGCLMAFYLMENCCSSTASYLSNFMYQEEAKSFIRTLRETAPVIKLSIQCYHYETRTETVTDSEGNSRTETHTERVDTHYASEIYEYDIYKDYTQFPPFAFPVMKMALKEYHAFEDEYTESHFNQTKSDFIRCNNLDHYYDFSVSRWIPGMRDRILVETEPGARHRNWNSCCFCISVLTCWAPCFRMWFLKKTGKETVRVTKSVQKLPQRFYKAVPISQPNALMGLA